MMRLGGSAARTGATALCVLTGVCFGQSNRSKIEFEGRFWAPRSSPEVKIDAPRLNQGIRFGRDLGTSDPRLADLRLTFRPGNHRLQVSFNRFLFQGDQEVTRTVEFNGRLYTGGTRVVTDASVRDFKAGWSYALLRAGDGLFRLGPLSEVHVLWWDASLTAPALAAQAADRRTIAFPTIGLAMELTPHSRISIFAEGSGLTAGDYGRFYNAEAGVRVSPAAHVNFVGGFRVFDLFPKFDTDYARLRLTGPFVGAALSF